MTATIDQPNHITVKEAAIRGRVHKGTVRRWMKEGLFEWRFKNRLEREINEESFERFLTDLRSPVSHSTA